MPRAAKVHWHRRNRRWYANIGEPDANGRATEVYAPPGLGPRDEAGAWEWLGREKAGRAAVAADPAAVSVEWVCEHYLAWAEGRVGEGKLAPEHYTNKQFHLGRFAGEFGPRPARSLTAADMTAYAGRLSARYAPTYARNQCASAVAALNWAVRAGHLAANPVAGFEMPTVPRSAERFAERREAAAFLRFWRNRAPRRDGRYSRLAILMVRCMIRTGARPKELCRLRWRHLRWEGGVTSAGHGFAKAVLPEHKTARKTGKPRTVYFTPALTRALRREHDRGGSAREAVFVHGRGFAGKGDGEPWADGSVFSHVVRRVRKEAVAEAARRAAEGRPTGGLERIRDEGENRFVAYRLRHTAASTLLMLGVDVPTVAELLGTSPEMIYRSYGHLLDSHLAAAAEKLAGRGGKSGGA